MTDTTHEDVERLIERLWLNTPVITDEHKSAATEIMPQAADTIRAFSARVQELERERDALERVRREEQDRILSIYRKLSWGEPVGAGDGNTFTVRHVSPDDLAAAIRGDDER